MAGYSGKIEIDLVIRRYEPKEYVGASIVDPILSKKIELVTEDKSFNLSVKEAIKKLVELIYG